MKNHFTNALKNLSGRVAVMTVVLVLILNSCKKEESRQPNLQPITISEVQTWLAKNKPSLILEKNWQKANMIDLGDGMPILKVPLNETLVNYNTWVLTDLLFYKNADGKIENMVSKVLVDTSYLVLHNYSGKIGEDMRNYINDADFTGKILLYDINNKIVKGRVYVDGKLNHLLEPTLAKNLKDRTLMSIAPIGCSDDPREFCGGGGTLKLVEIIGTRTSPREVWIFPSRTPNKDFPFGSNTNDIPIGNGRGGKTSKIDCAGVTNGTAYQSDCGCIGGTTGIKDCAEIKHKLDSFPCAKELVLQMSTLNSDISKLIRNAFDKNDRINLTILANQSLAGTSDDGKLGQHSKFTYDNKLNFNINIEINPDILKNATKEYILVTIYHEALHAYFALKLEELGQTEFNNQFTGLYVNGGRLLGVQDSQHWSMGYTNFVNGLRDVILAYNPNFDSTRAYAMALGGINVLTPAQLTINQQERNTSVVGYTGTKCP